MVVFWFWLKNKDKKVKKRNGICFLVDVAKRAGRVGFGSGQSGLRVKRVTGQNGSFLNGLTGLRVNRVSGRVGLTRIFQTNFFFFFFGNRCNLSIVYEFLNCD